MSDVRIKICGLTTPEDARIAADLGADYFGMILSQGFKRSILPSRAVDIELAVDARLVGVFVDESVSEVERICGMIGTSVIQLHGEEERDYVEELRRRGDWAIWKAIRVRSTDRMLCLRRNSSTSPRVPLCETCAQEARSSLLGAATALSTTGSAAAITFSSLATWTG